MPNIILSYGNFRWKKGRKTKMNVDNAVFMIMIYSIILYDIDDGLIWECLAQNREIIEIHIFMNFNFLFKNNIHIFKKECQLWTQKNVITF